MKTIISMTLALFVFVITSCTSNDYGKEENAQKLQTNVSEVSTLQDINSLMLEINQKYVALPNSRTAPTHDTEVAACDALGAMCALQNAASLIFIPHIAVGSVIGCAVIASASCMLFGDHCQIVDGEMSDTTTPDWRITPRQALRFPLLAGVLYEPVTKADSIAYYHNVIAEQIMHELPNVNNVTPESLEAPTCRALISRGLMQNTVRLQLADNSLYMAMLSDVGHYESTELSMSPHASQLLPEYEDYKYFSETISTGLASTNNIAELNSYITEVLSAIRSSNLDQEEKFMLEVIACVALASHRLWVLDADN